MPLAGHLFFFIFSKKKNGLKLKPAGIAYAMPVRQFYIYIYHLSGE